MRLLTMPTMKPLLYCFHGVLDERDVKIQPPLTEKLDDVRVYARACVATV